MAEINEVASFSINTSNAQKELNAYIAKLQVLETELKQLEKEGKDTARVQAEIAKTTQQATNAINKNTQAVQNNEKASDKSAKVNTRAAARIRGVGGAAAFGAGSLLQFAGGLEIGSVGMGILVSVADKAFNALQSILFPLDQVNELSKKLAETFVEEGVAAAGAFEAIELANVGTTDRAAAIAAVNEQYGQYLPNLLTEKSSTEDIAAAYDLVNEAILQNILVKAQQEEATKAVAQIVQGNIALAKAEAEGATPLIIQVIKESIKAAENSLRTLDSTFAVVKNNLKNAQIDFGAAATSTAEKLAKAKNLLANLGSLNLAPSAELAARKELEKEIENLTKLEGGRKAAIERTAQAATKAATKEKSEYIVLNGSLAFLEAELSRVNKLLNEQANVADTQTLTILAEQYNLLKIKTDEARKAIEALKAEQKPIEVIDIDTLNATTIRVSELKTQLEQLQIDNINALTEIEKQRNKSVAGVQGNRAAEEAINKQYDATRLAAEQQQTRAVLQLKLRILDATEQKSKEDLLNIAQIKLELEQLNNIPVSIDTTQATQDTKKLKETILQIAEGIGQIGQQLLQFAQQNTQAVISQYDTAIQKQQSALDTLLGAQNTANAQQVLLEQKRLEALQEQREKAKNKEVLLIQLQIAANAALTIARAAAEGGGIASAITIAAAIAAMAIGFAQAKAQSQQAFFEGTAYAQLNGSPKGRDTINARINEGEAVIPTATNAKYKNAVLGIYQQSVPASLLNSVSEAYANGSLDISKVQGAKIVGFSNAEKNSIGLVVSSGGRMNEKRIVNAVERVVDAVLSKRELNITERGLEYVVSKRLKKRVLNLNKFK